MNKSSRLKILFIAQELCKGGAAFLCVNWINRLVTKYDIDLLITGEYDEEIVSELPSSVNVIINKRSLIKSIFYRLGVSSPLGSIRFIVKSLNAITNNRFYNAVIGTSILANWQASSAFCLANSPNKIIFLVDEALASYPHDNLRKKALTELSLLLAKNIVSVSRGLHQSMSVKCEILRHKPYEIIWPLTNIENFSRPRQYNHDSILNNKPIVLTVARLTPGKQIFESLHIHFELKQLGVDFRWHILGNGPQYSILQNEIKRLGMQDHFILEGFQRNISEWMLGCDIFALFSASEGCPTVVIEALKLNCIVITSDVNGVNELIDNQNTGVIVPNSKEIMKLELSRLIKDINFRERIKNNLMQNPLNSGHEQDEKKIIQMIGQQIKDDDFPLITILIPTCNQEDKIDTAISSALMQNYPSLEVIAVDDNSTDQTEKVCKKWLADKRFRFIKNTTNLGRVGNYHHSLCNLALGEWVLMLDGDDYLTDVNFIQTAFNAITKYADRNVVFVQGGHTVRHYELATKDIDILPQIEDEDKLVPPGGYLNFVYQTGFFTHLGILFNRSAAIEHGCYTLEISSSDMDSFLRLSLKGSVVLLKRVAGCWIQHDKNTSANLKINDIPDNVKIFRKITELAIKEGLIQKQKINPSLSKYEMQTIAFLFFRAINKSDYRRLSFIKLIPIIFSVNPKLFFSLILYKSTMKSICNVISKKIGFFK